MKGFLAEFPRAEQERSLRGEVQTRSGFRNLKQITLADGASRGCLVFGSQSVNTRR